MLRANDEPRLSEQDDEIFEQLVLKEHYLRQVKAVLDFERYRAARQPVIARVRGAGQMIRSCC